jgi:hypothetical protein
MLGQSSRANPLPRRYLGFHQVRIRYGAESTVLFPDPKGSQEMIDSYPPDIRNWILAKGGLGKMPSEGFWTLTRSPKQSRSLGT